MAQYKHASAWITMSASPVAISAPPYCPGRFVLVATRPVL